MENTRSNSLEVNKETDKNHNEYIFGKHPVLEALKSGRAINKIFISTQYKRTGTQPILSLAKSRGLVVLEVDKNKLNRLTSDTIHQGVAAQVAPADYVDLSSLFTTIARKPKSALILLLDEVEDPHNLGSIIRTADCAGVDGIIIPKRRSVGLTATVSKTSAGAIEYMPVTRVANLVETMKKLKKAGLWIAGADVAGSCALHNVDLTGPLAIVIGNESKGLSRLVKEHCDFLVSLPMCGRINSLNASVAAGVFLYEVLRQRQA